MSIEQVGQKVTQVRIGFVLVEGAPEKRSDTTRAFYSSEW